MLEITDFGSRWILIKHYWDLSSHYFLLLTQMTKTSEVVSLILSLVLSINFAGFFRM